MNHGSIRVVFTCLLVAAWFWTPAVCFVQGNDDAAGTQVQSIVAKVRAGQRVQPGEQGFGGQLVRLGAAAVPELIRNAQDANQDVRLAVVDALNGLRDPRAIPALYRSLTDPDRNVSAYAMAGLCDFQRQFPQEVADGYTAGGGRANVLAYALRMRDACKDAILLIGRLEDRSASATLTQILESRRASTDPAMRGRMFLNVRTGEVIWDYPTRIDESALKVLFGLGDPAARSEINQAMSGDSATSRTMAVGCVAYAKRADLAKDLIPLLDDARDGAIIGPQPGSLQWLRVQDVAATALVGILDIDPNAFRQTRDLRYDPGELERVKALAQQKLAAK